MARNARRGTPHLLFAAALTAFLAFAVLATSVSGSSAAPAQASRAGSLCQIGDFPSGGGGSAANRAAGVAQASITPLAAAKGLSKFVVEKAVGANIERWGIRGISWFTRLIGVGGLAPDSGERRILGQMEAINSRLAEVEARIDRVGERVNRLVGLFQRSELNRAVTQACNAASKQMALFRTYSTALDSGLDLGAILEGRVAATTAERQVVENRVIEDIDEFVDDYRQNYGRSSREIDNLRQQLVPNQNDKVGTPVLTLFGEVLLSRGRFLDRADSEALRAFYRAVSEIRALATLMAAEYWDAREREANEKRVLRVFMDDTRAAQKSLPKMIPPGVVIDLGSNDRDTANRMPMWFAPTTKDLGWFPRQEIGGAPLVLEGVGKELRKLNAKAGYGKGWSAPHPEEFKALITTGCRVDPDHPARQLRGCRNAVPSGSNIAAYLQPLNKEDKTWQQLFCQRSVNPKCPPGAGPVAVRQAPHPFIWVSGQHSQRLICGRIARSSHRSDQFATRYSTYSGFHLLASDYRFHEITPHLPMRSAYTGVLSGANAASELRGRCDRFIRELIFGGGPPPRQKPNPMFHGVLLANRFSGPQDINPVSRWDFMAQRPNG